nr:MAG TPA: hypothetical protein [Caudoviricetes sp.]
MGATPTVYGGFKFRSLWFGISALPRNYQRQRLMYFSLY